MNVIVSDIDEILPALQSGQIDAVFNLMVFKPPAGLVYIPLREDECVVLCAADHRLARQECVTLADLSTERWSLGEPGLPTQQKLHQAFRDHGLDPPRVGFETRLISMRVQVASRSDLLLYTSRNIAEKFEGLRVLPVKELHWVRSVGVLHREERYLSPAVRRFIRILSEMNGRAEIDAARPQR